MFNQRFKRNYSQSDIGRLINESQKRADYINKIIDGDIHFLMMTESNTPFKERLKYIRGDYNINNKNYIKQNSQRMILKNYNNINYPNRINDKRFVENSNNYINKDKYYINNNYKYSFDVNKPFHRERKHFPLINNEGNFFKKENKIFRKKLFNDNDFSNSENDYNKNIKYAYNNRYNDYSNGAVNVYNNNNKNYRNQNIRRNNSMVNISDNFPKINIQNKLNYGNIQYSENDQQNEEDEDNPNSRNNKYYMPRRYDYEGSRYGDKTYNYYLNEPMRSDITSDWKFPPLYRYNTKIDYGNNFSDYNYEQ